MFGSDWLAGVLAGVRRRRAALAGTYAYLQYLDATSQWMVDYAGPRWWEDPHFTLGEIAIEYDARQDMEAAKRDLPLLLRLGVRWWSTSKQWRRSERRGWREVV